MKKLLILTFVMLLSVIPIIYAMNFTDLFSFERDDKNNICDKGEFPIIDKDCKLDFSDIMNKVWFWKVLLIIGLFYMLKKKDILNKNVIIVLLVILIAFTMPIKEKPELEGEIVKINQTEDLINPLEKTTAEKIIDGIGSLGSRLSPDRPIIGWAVIGIILWILSGIFSTSGDIRDRFFDFKIKNLFRGKKR